MSEEDAEVNRADQACACESDMPYIEMIHQVASEEGGGEDQRRAHANDVAAFAPRFDEHNAENQKHGGAGIERCIEDGEFFDAHFANDRGRLIWLRVDG